MADADRIAIGVGLGSFGDGLPEPSELFRYVERADELGIDSLWMPDPPSPRDRNSTPRFRCRPSPPGPTISRWARASSPCPAETRSR